MKTPTIIGSEAKFAFSVEHVDSQFGIVTIWANGKEIGESDQLVMLEVPMHNRRSAAKTRRALEGGRPFL